MVLLVPLRGAADAPSPPALRSPLQWRPIGPFRGGRTTSVVGVPGRPHEFYLGATDGGVFKTVDGGRTWRPIFDDQPTASIGAIAVAPSAPDTVYVGSGEGRQRPDLSTGDGIYRSRDGGMHWEHLGLRDGKQIPKIVVDPHDPQRLFVAVLGSPYGPGAQRGVFRSTDGGATFARVLGPNDDAGAFDLALDPSDANVVYATLWAARQAPWELASGGGSIERPAAGSGLYVSRDGGTNWSRIEGGLPTIADGIGRTEIAVSPADPRRLYAFADARRRAGLYRSDDAGAHWTLANATPRVTERGGDLITLAADPKDRDTVYETNTSTYRSTDAGRTMIALRGAPGGDDYQSVWIAPDDPQTIALGSDQGAIVSYDGGASWSSWYNQPTAQFYHVAVDDRFPYRVYGGQQESGSAEVLSRGDDGVIGMREWHPVGTEEY
ncbi:MAG: glycoside hydrolase, partial [Candidatus Eremiobacteraeota bacterium]|nr:glycoside hydrolase [Candidatus Eremiobacteraeota bacterium]